MLEQREWDDDGARKGGDNEKERQALINQRRWLAAKEERADRERREARRARHNVSMLRPTQTQRVYLMSIR